ncbi:hypothetical protein EW145_g7686, partial [Phellinidium pouzarii]
IEALLQLKAGQLRAADDWSLAGSQMRGGQEDEVVVVASGSDRHPNHTDMMVFDDANGSNRTKTGRHEEVRHLVAKMIFRRRDSPRSLSGKSASPIRPYIRSSLSRTVLVNDSNSDDIPIVTETDTS